MPRHNWSIQMVSDQPLTTVRRLIDEIDHPPPRERSVLEALTTGGCQPSSEA